MTQILITGVAGFIGMHCAIECLKNGFDVVGIDNLNNYYSESLKLDRIVEINKNTVNGKNRFTFLRLDINADLTKELESFEIDFVLHLAAQAGVRYSVSNPEKYVESNINGFFNVIEFVRFIKPKLFVYASSSSVYGNSDILPFEETQPCNVPASFYAATKKINEIMSYSYYNTYGLKSVGLRFFTVYGPWGRPDMAPMLFTKAAFEGNQVDIFNYGKQLRDFTYVDDISGSIIEILKNPDKIKGAEIFNIGYGSPSSLMDFIEIIESLSEKVICKNFVEAQTGDVKSTFANTKKLATVFNYKPKVELFKGLSMFIEWYKKYYQIK